MSDTTEAHPVLQKNKSNNVSNDQSKEPDMKTRFNMLRKMKEDLEKMNRRERRYVVEDEDNDNVHCIKAGNCGSKKKDDKNSLLKLVEKKKKKMMIQKKYESMNGVNTGIIQENNESEEESNSKSNAETPHKFKETKFMNSLNNVKEFKTEDDVGMVNKEEKNKIVEEDEDGNGSDEQNGNEENKEDVKEEDKKEEEEKIKEEKNIIKQRLLKLALDKKMKKEEEIKEKSKDINVNVNNDEGNNEDDNDDQNENNNDDDVNDNDKTKEYNSDNDGETEFNPSSLLLKDNSSSKKELRNIINILKSKSNKQQPKELISDTNTDQIVPNETSPQKTNTSQDNNNNTTDSPNHKANNSSSNDDDDNNVNDNDKDKDNNDTPPQPSEPTEEEQQQLQYKKELEERAIKRNKYLEFKKQQVIQKRKYEEELAEQKRLEEIQRKEEERLAEIEKKRKEELIRLERQQQAEAREAEKKKREERKRRDAMRKAGEQRLEREVKRQEQRKEFEFKRLELKLNNKGKDVITVNGSFDRSIDNINNDSNTNYFSELTYVKQTPISKRKNICDVASSPKVDDVKKDNFRQNNKIDVKKNNNVFETETKIKMKAPVTLIYSPKRAGRSSSNDKLSRSIVDVNEIKENKAYNANQPYVKQRSGGLSVGKKNNNNVNVSNYNSQYNNINVRKNPFMNYNNNMNNRTQTNFGQDALIDDHYTTINHHHHNINNTNITNIRTNFYSTMPNFNYNTNNNSNNNSNINNNTNSNSNNSINQFNNNNINYSQIGSLLPPAPPTPQPKAQYSLNIEDLITLEEKLSEITSALNLNQYIRNECFEWWNYYFNHSNYSQIHLTFDKSHQPFIERSIKYQILSILICYDVSSDQYVLSSIEHMIQAILNRNHMNFILVCEYVLSKISLDNYDNVWVYKLRNLVNTHKINYVNFINEYGDNVSYVDKINSNTNSVINDIRIIVKYYQNSNPKADELLFLLKKIEQLSYNEINAIVQEKFMIGQKMNSNILPYDYNYNSSLRESNNFNYFSENTSCNMGVNGGNGNNYFNGGNNSGFYLDTQDVYGNNLEMNGNYY